MSQMDSYILVLLVAQHAEAMLVCDTSSLPDSFYTTPLEDMRSVDTRGFSASCIILDGSVTVSERKCM